MTVLESAYSAARGLTVGPPPAWVDARPFERPQPPRPEIIDDGVAWWLVDEVSDLTGEAPAWCSRMVKEVVGAGGLGATAAFDVTYSPEYERLVVHHIRVIRNGKVREVARPEAFEIMRRERDLERAMYDGRLTAHLQIPDLRVGDIVDLCHSVIGANPVHRGWYGAAHSLQWGVAVDTVRIRMRAPARRQFDMRYWGQAPAYEERPLEGGLLEREWLAKGFPAFRYERDTPPWWVGHSKVVVAERMSWAEVAGVYAPGYESGDALPEELEAFAAELEASGATPAERAVAALRLVQRELRYLAISIGEGGLVPRPIDEVWGARAGDCKDASRLLTALLRRLSVEAAPALVNTELGWDLGDTPPNLISFNHCICRVRIDGRTWWLDATGAEQGGRLDALFQSRHGYALPLVEQAELEWMGEHETVTVVESEQDWTFPARLSSPTVARIATTYRSWRADDIRRWLRDDGPEAAAKQYRDYYEREFGEVRSTAPLKVEDRFDDNELVVEETYEFTRPFRIEDGSANYFSDDDVVGPHLIYPDNMRRTMPLNLGLPRRMKTTRTLRFPCASPYSASNHSKDGPGVAGRSVFTAVDDRTLRAEVELVIAQRTVQPDKAEAFNDFAREMRTINGVSFTLPVTKDRLGAKTVRHWRSYAVWAVIWIVILLIQWLARAG